MDIKDILPKLGNGVAQTVLAGLALWSAPKVGFGPALAGWSIASALLSKAIGQATVAEAAAVAAPGTATGAGAFFLG